MTLIAFTGTPASGKTTLAKAFCKASGYKYIDLNEYAKEHGLQTGYDEERQCPIVDAAALREHSFGPCSVLDSHFSHFSPADRVVVVECSDLKVLKKRLEARGYPAQKVRENLDAEIFKVCRTEALEERDQVLIIDTAGQTVASCIAEITAWLQKPQ
jgi:adenylate kinase